MLEYLTFTVPLIIIAVNLTFWTIEYLRITRKCYNILKALLLNMDDLKLALEPETTDPKRDRLRGVIAAGDSKKYLGKDYSLQDIDALDPIQLDRLYGLYEAKFGKEVVVTVGNYLLSTYSRILGLVTPIQVMGYDVHVDSEEELTEELSKDPIIKTGMASVLSEVCFKYGPYISPLVATIITSKHLHFKKSNDLKKSNLLINGIEGIERIDGSEGSSSSS